MIHLKPCENTAYVQELFSKSSLPFSKDSGCVTACIGEEVLGYSLYSLDCEKMTVHIINPLKDIPLADGILRSTLHVAAERGIMNAFYSESLPEDFLEKIGFIKNRSEKRLDIDKLFKSCCNCGG